MPQIYEVELDDGRIVELESDYEPSEQDVLGALKSYQPDASAAPAGNSPPDEQELEELFSQHHPQGAVGKSQLPDRTAEIPELLGESVRENPFTKNRQAVMSISGLPESPHNPFREYEGQEYSGTDALAKMGVGLQAGFNELGRQGWTALQALQEPLVKVGPLSLTPSGIRRTGATIENAQFAREAAMESGRMAEEKQSLQAEIPGPPILGDVGAGLVSTVPAMAAGPFGVAGVVGASGIQQGAATLARAQDVYEGQQQAFDRYGRLMSDLGVFKNPDKVASTKPVNPTESNEAFDVMPNRAFWRASVPAALDAAQTAAITALSGKLFGLGAEGATVRQSTKMIQNKVGNYAKGIVGESLEEGAQQFVSDYVIAKMSYDPKITFEDAVKSAIGAAAVGGIIGGGVGALSLLPRDGERPAATVPGAEATTAAELPAGTPLDVDVEAFNKANAAPAPAEAPAAESGPLTEEQFSQQYPVKPLPVRPPKPPTLEQGKLLTSAETPEGQFKVAAKKHGYAGEVEFVDEADISEGDLLDNSWAVESGGKIKVNRAAWERMTTQQRTKLVEQVASEEAIHSHTQTADALDYFKNSTDTQRAIGRKIYLAGADPNTKLSDAQLGKEMLRRTVQRLNGVKPTELNELVGREKWTVASLDAVDRVINKTRQALGTKASKAQLAALDRVQGNINKAKAIIGLAESQPDEDETEQEAYDRMEREGMESGALIRSEDVIAAERGTKDFDADAVTEMSDDELNKLMTATEPGGARSYVPQYGSALWGASQPAGETAKVEALAKDAQKRMMSEMAKGPQMDAAKFQAEQGRMLWYNGALEGIRREGGNFRSAIEKSLGIRHDGTVAGRDSWTIMEDGVQGQNFITKKGATLDEIRTKMESIKSGTAGEPQQEAAALQRGGPSKRGQEIAEQKRRILEMQAKARGEELPPELQSKTGPVAGAAPGPVAPEERVSAEAAGADRRLNALEIEQKADENLAGPVNLKERPGFGEFSKWASNNVEGVKPDQIRAMWEDAVWGNLLNATPERLVEWRQALGLESRYGRAKIAAAKPPEGFRLEAGGDKVLERQNRASAEAAQRYRNKVIAAVARKLISESVTDRPSLTRQQVGIDDLDFSNAKTKFGPYVELNRDDISNLETLNHILRDQARASSVDPESASRRLVAVVDPAGKVELLSTYNDAGVQRVTDPAGARMAGKPNRELNKAFLRQYRPFASLLLADPVKGFRQKFESVSEFNDKIAEEARQRATIGEFPGEGPAAGFEAEGTPGLEGEGGSFVGPGRAQVSGVRGGTLESAASITAPEARGIIDHIFTEVGNFQTADDVRLSLLGLTERAAAKKLTSQDRLAISGYRKMFSALEKQFPNASREDLLDQMADKIYENHNTSQDLEAFVQKTLAEFPREGARNVSPQQAVNQVADQIEDDEETAALRRSGPRRTMGEWTANVLSDFGGIYDKWMVDRLDEYGGPVSKQAAAGFRHIIDREKQLYGLLTPLLDRARRLAGGIDPGNATTIKGKIGELPARAVESAKALRTANWLGKINSVTPDAGVANTVGAIEGKIAIPSWAQSVVGAARAANLEIGMILQPVIKGFLATGKFQRNFTSLGYDIIKQGGGKMWESWTRGIAAANPKKGVSLTDMTQRVRAHFKKIKTELDDPGVSGTILEKINQDLTRAYPEAITHVKGPGGRWQPVIHSDLFPYLENAARRATHVRAFREQFPNTDIGRAAFQSLLTDVRRELPDGELHRDLDALVKSMHGHPTDDYNGGWQDILRMGPQQGLGQAMRMANQTVGNVMAKMVLTGQMFVQPGEVIAGSTPVFLGYKNYLRALAQYRQLYPTLELDGAVNRIMRDYTFNPNSPFRSTFKILGSGISKLAAEAALNELQEGLAAATARVVSENIVTGNLSAWEKSMLPQTFKIMGFNPGEVQRLMRGDQELIGQFQRKAAAFLTGGNKATAEGSRLGANRLFNSVFRFQSYPMIKLNQARRVNVNLAESIRTGQNIGPAARTAGRFYFGNALQGALTNGIVALAYGGLSGLKIKKEEAKDEPVKFMLESFLASMSGPMYLVYRGAKQRGIGGVGEQALRAAFPYGMMNDLNDMAQGEGQFKDMDTFDRIGKFLANKTPGTQAIGTGLAMFGLANESQPLDQSLKALGRWKRDELGYIQTERHLENDERAEFRTQIKKAIEAMKNGDEEAFIQAWMGAVGENNVDGVGKSLRSRKVLTGPDGKVLTEEQKESLQNRIGFEAYDRLEYYDLMLEQAAKGVLLPQD